MTSELQREMRLGDLLVHLDLISESDLNEASQLAVELGLPLGKVLVMSDFISEPQLAAMVQAQSMLKDHLLEMEVARRAVELLSKDSLTWGDALKAAGWVEPHVLPTNKLGKLLVDSGIVTDDELEHALVSAKQSGLPLGRVFSASGRVPEQLLISCLNAQVLLRDGKINRQQAVKALKAAHARQTSIEQALAEQGEYRAPARVRVKLGEMFVLSRLLSEVTMVEIIERGLIDEQPIGQVMLKGGHITAEQLEAALKLQQLVDAGTLNPINSSEALHQVCLRGISLDQAIQELGVQKESTQTQLSLADLLKLAGILSEEHIAEAFRRSMENPQIFGRILVMTGFIDEIGMQVALECQALVRSGTLREDQAIIALNYCSRMNCTLEQAAIELGWKQGARAQAPDRKRTKQEELAATAAKAALQFFD